MSRDDYINAGIDYDEGVHRFMGNESLYETFVKKFAGDPTFPDLQKAMAGNDAEKAFQLAHTLKGVTGNLSFNALLEKLKPVVEALRGGDIAAARVLFPKVEAEYGRVMDCIGGRGE